MKTILRLSSAWPLAAACALSFGSPAVSAAERMAAGQWEFAMTTDGETHAAQQCVTAEKAGEVNGDSRSGREQVEKNAKGRCVVDAYDIAGDVVTYTLTCGPRTMQSVTTFHGDSSEGSLVTTAQGKSIRTLIKARRLGPCSK